MPQSHAAPEGYVFIVTYGRSGSTLVQKILNSIPGYCVRGENNNGLFYVYQVWREMTQARAIVALRKQKRQSENDHPWYGAELIEPDAFGHALRRTFVDEVLKPPKGTRVAGFKEIRWHASGAAFPDFMRFLHAFFPNSKVIVNTRNLDAVSNSGWWKKEKPEDVKAILGRAEARFSAYLAEFPEASIHLHYDDYTGNPDAFAPLFEFLGEPFDRDAIATILDTPLNHLKKSQEQDAGMITRLPVLPREG